MKTKKILLACALGFSLLSKAQWPSPLHIDTATDPSNTGVITVGSPSYWQSNNASISGPYSTAVRVAGPPSGWAASPDPKAEWISHPHGCSGAIDPSESWCIIPHDHEEFYKVSFTLGAPGAYGLKLRVFADNCIYKMYLNSSPTAFYSAPSAGAYYYVRSNHTGSGIITNITSGWQPGVNTLYIHVKSGVNPNHIIGNTGLLVSVIETTYVPSENWPEEPVGGDCCLGNSCSDSQNALAESYEIPLNDFNFNFSDDKDHLNGKVNVGYDCNTSDIGKLNAFTNIPTNQGDEVGSSAESISIYGLNHYNARGTGVGVMGVAENHSDNQNSVGVWGEAKGLGNNIGGNFFASNGNFFNIGVSGVALPASFGGVVPKTYGMYPNARIGVYGAGDPGNSDRGSPGSNWAAWFDGDVYINGTGYYTGFTVISDRKFKKEIKPIENASDLISRLKPSNYLLNTTNEYGLNFSSSKQYGFISQEVEAVLPDLVEDVHKPEVIDKTGKVIKKAVDYKSLNYIGFIALLTKGAQEQQKTNDLQTQAVNDLQKQLEEQKQLIKTLSDKLAGTTGITTDTGVGAGFQMSQNEPNPFTHETVVKYTLPQTVASAFMAVYDLSGKQITSFPIDKKGNASITLTSEKLPAGIYIYSIVADGKVVDSKRMIVADK